MIMNDTQKIREKQMFIESVKTYLFAGSLRLQDF